MMLGNYPPGSDVSYSPWYEDYKVPETVNVWVSESLHKGIKVTVPDGENYETIVNKENWTLEETLQKAADLLELMKHQSSNNDSDYINCIIRACRGWIQDEREVVKDD